MFSRVAATSSTFASQVRIEIEPLASGTLSQWVPPFGCITWLRFIQVLGVYCVMSNTTHSSHRAISAKCPRYGKK